MEVFPATVACDIHPDTVSSVARQKGIAQIPSHNGSKLVTVVHVWFEFIVIIPKWRIVDAEVISPIEGAFEYVDKKIRCGVRVVVGRYQGGELFGDNVECFMLAPPVVAILDGVREKLAKGIITLKNISTSIC